MTEIGVGVENAIMTSEIKEEVGTLLPVQYEVTEMLQVCACRMLDGITHREVLGATTVQDGEVQ